MPSNAGPFHDGERWGSAPLRQALSWVFVASWITVAVLMVAFGAFNPFYVILMGLFAVTGVVQFMPGGRTGRGQQR